MSIRLTLLGHSSVLLEDGSIRLLTDPVLSNRVLLLKRHNPLPLKPEDLPDPTVVLISHAHYDHLDIPSFKYISSQATLVMPAGVGRLVARHLQNTIVELSHGSSHEIRPGVTVTAFPVAHNGFRLSGLTYRNCNGYLIEWEGKKIFFAGDTGYRSDFANFQGIDTALLPLGPCEPVWFMRGRHLNAEDLVRVAEEMQPKKVIPIHWGTFRLGADPLSRPMEDLRSLVAEKGIGDQLAILSPGESIALD